MPVITPAYPSMCATHNVTASTLEVITSEFARAADISEKIMKGKLPWSALFVKHDFFLKYKYYLAITAASKSAETQVKWYTFPPSPLKPPSCELWTAFGYYGCGSVSYARSLFVIGKVS